MTHTLKVEGMKPKTRKFNLRDALARPDLVLVTNHPDIEIVKVEMTHDGLYPVLLTARDGTRADFNNVNDAIQCAGSACAYFERQEDADLQIELINRGASAMQRMRDRWVSHQVLRFDGQGMQDAREAINIYIEFLGTLTRKQMRDAFAFAMREERKAA